MPDDAEVTVVYTAEFAPVEDYDDDLRLGMEYWGLVDTWFRWKCEEYTLAGTEECKYFHARFEDELRRLRAEHSNRMNAPQGRSLAGFGR